MSGETTAIRGPVLAYTGDPFKDGIDHTMVYEPDAVVAMADGRIWRVKPCANCLAQMLLR